MKINGTNCPLCSSNQCFIFSTTKDYEYFTSDMEYTYYECKKCRCIFIKNPPEDKLNLIYPKNYYSNNILKKKYNSVSNLTEQIKSFFDLIFFRKIFRKIGFKKINSLDIGGGSGWISNLIRKADNRVSSTTVIDFDDEAEKIATENGHIYYKSNISDIRIRNKYEFIVMFNIIEHINNPEKALIKIKSLMLKNAILVIKTPNTRCLSKNLFKNLYWGGLHAPRHWILFNRENISALAIKCGYEIEDFFYTQGAPQWSTSILGSYFKIFNLKKNTPVYKHFASPILNIIFASFDYLFLTIFKTSQMYIILKKP